MLSPFVGRVVIANPLLVRAIAWAKVKNDKIHWGHVGDLQRYAALLRQITNAAFKVGEHAA